MCEMRAEQPCKSVTSVKSKAAKPTFIADSVLYFLVFLIFRLFAPVFIGCNKSDGANAICVRAQLT